jgi:hypothetical protein
MSRVLSVGDTLHGCPSVKDDGGFDAGGDLARGGSLISPPVRATGDGEEPLLGLKNERTIPNGGDSLATVIDIS